MRIAFVTQWFPPEPGTLVASAIADGLAARGHVVDVVTGFPNYPTGKLHPGYPLRRYRRDAALGTRHRSPGTAVPEPRHQCREADGQLRQLFRVRLVDDPSPAAETGCVADLLVTGHGSGAGLDRSPAAPCTILLAHPRPVAGQRHRKRLRPGTRRPGHRAITDKVLRLVLPTVVCDRYHLAGDAGDLDGAGRRWLEDPSHPQLDRRQHLLPDVAPSDDLRRSLGLPTGRLFMYAGNMGELQGLEPLVEAFVRTPESHLALVGDGVAKPGLQELVSRSNAHNVTFVDSQPTDRIAQFIAASDVQIVSLKDSHLLRATMPSKVQLSMAAGRPILAHAAGDVAQVVTDAHAGVSTPPGDVRSRRRDNPGAGATLRRCPARHGELRPRVLQAELTPPQPASTVWSACCQRAPGSISIRTWRHDDSRRTSRDSPGGWPIAQRSWVHR